MRRAAAGGQLSCRRVADLPRNAGSKGRAAAGGQLSPVGDIAGLRPTAAISFLRGCAPGTTRLISDDLAAMRVAAGQDPVAQLGRRPGGQHVEVAG